MTNGPARGVYELSGSFHTPLLGLSILPCFLIAASFWLMMAPLLVVLLMYSPHVSTNSRGDFSPVPVL